MLLRLFQWFEGLTDALPPEPPEKPPETLMAFVLHYSRPFWGLIAASMVLAVAIAVLEVSLFAFLGSLVDWLSRTDRAVFWSEHHTTLIWFGAVVVIALPVLKFVFETIVHQALLGNFAMRTRWQAHRYVLRQSMEFFQNDYAGRVATKVMQTSVGVRDTVLKVTDVLVYVGVYFTAALILFASSDLRLTAPMILWLAGYLTALYYFVPRLKQVSMEQADHRSIVTGQVVDSYTNVQTVKMFSRSDLEDAYVREGMTGFLDNVRRQMRLSNLLIMCLNGLNSLLIFSIAGLSIWLWTIDAVTTGAMAFAVGLVMRIQSMSQWVLFEVWSLFENIGVIQDGIRTIARPRTIVDAPDAATLQVSKGEIRFDNIHFNYGKGRDDVGPGVISGLSLAISPGEKVGIVGRSGAGKSTLVSLLLRFYDLEDGRILIDGQDIAKVTQESLRQQIGMVTQDTSLLHRSVIDNIRYGMPEKSLEEVEKAAARAHAHDFIGGLEDREGRTGYEAQVGERGVKLSGGQRQRIAIARVLLKDAPILILDEATSALDSEVEAAIQESFTELMQGKTVIAIAHRLSTIAAMDRLIVMDQGRIVEEGSHEDLRRRGGLYADLWARQSGGFLASAAAE